MIRTSPPFLRRWKRLPVLGAGIGCTVSGPPSSPAIGNRSRTPSIAAGAFKASFIGPAASSLVVEVSANLRTWVEGRRVEPFGGTDLPEMPGSVDIDRFFRAYLLP